MSASSARRASRDVSERSVSDDVYYVGGVLIGERPGGRCASAWGATFLSASAQGSHVVATDAEASLLRDVHQRGGRRSRLRAPRGSYVVVTDLEELLLGDVHLRGGDARVGERAKGRWAASGSRLWPVLPSHAGPSFAALGRENDKTAT